jgi:hypothetical protein
MKRDDEGRDGGAGEPRQTSAGTEREATEVEREGMDLLGRSSVRDGAIAGVSDASARSDQRAGDAGTTGAGTGPRRSPGENPAAAAPDGGLSASGGVAGGARGHGGRSDAMDAGLGTGSAPSERESTSRIDPDHGTVDRPGGGGFTDDDDRSRR